MRLLGYLLRFFTYLYLLRFPALTAVALIGLVIAAFFTSARPLLGNLLDIFWPGGIFLLSLTAFITAWVVMLTWRLVLLYGETRFQLESFIDPYEVSPNVRWRHLILFGFLALPLVGGAISFTWIHNDHTHFVRMLIEASFGLVFAFLILCIAAVVQKFFTRPSYAQGRPPDVAQRVPDTAKTSPDMFLPFNTLLEPILTWVSRRNPASRFAEKIVRLFRRVPEAIGRGYFEYANNHVVSILPGHVLAIILFLLTVLLYAVVGLYKSVHLGGPPVFPTLGYALLLLMLLCWGLSGAAFFLDRFRIPVLIPLLMLLFVTSQFPWSDHFYPVIPVQAPPNSAVPLQSTAAASGTEDSIVVVAANGGGIQAAAWTARVLTGLAKDQDVGVRFSNSLRLISAVSGGSVGAMYFVNEYAAGGPPPGEELDKIVDRTEESSLDKIAWGLVYPDFLRLLVPYKFKWDRGRALEDAWLNALPRNKREKLRKEGLSYWRAEAEARRRPGLIFNTTIAETGERLPLSTIDLPPDSQGRRIQKQFLEGLCPETKAPPCSKDIPVVTATRLSASFPYVSPAARAEVQGPGAHIVDGGYYDNYGMSSLVEWLDHELKGGTIARVLVVRIRGAATEEKEGEEERKTKRGWFYQAFAPVSTLLQVRTAGQLFHSELELRLLIEKWRERQGKKVEITPVVFEFPEAETPLSWHLNRKEKEAIEEEWRSNTNSVAAVKNFFARTSQDQ